MACIGKILFNRHRKYFFLFLCFCIFLPVFVIYEEYSSDQKKKLFYDGNVPVIYRDIFPNPDEFNIFLIETSFKESLSSKVLCCIESYCRVNPTATIWMAVTATSLNQNTTDIMKELLKVCNLKYVAADVFLTLSETPLENLPKSLGFWRSRILFYNLSDLMRLAMVFKSGGFYSDTDLLATQSIANRTNFLVYNGLGVSNAVFHFNANHPYLFEVMEYIKHNFHKDLFTFSGAVAVSYTIQKRCPNVSDHILPTPVHQAPTLLKLLVEDFFKYPLEDPCKPYESIVSKPPPVHFHCKGIDVLEPVSFLAIDWRNWRKLFDQTPESICLDKLMGSAYGIHLSGYISSLVELRNGSALQTLTSLTCPKIYQKTNGVIFS